MELFVVIVVVVRFTLSVWYIFPGASKWIALFRGYESFEGDMTGRKHLLPRICKLTKNMCTTM